MGLYRLELWLGDTSDKGTLHHRLKEALVASCPAALVPRFSFRAHSKPFAVKGSIHAPLHGGQRGKQQGKSKRQRVQVKEAAHPSQ